MPYIKQWERDNLDQLISDLAWRLNSDGQMNYTITKLLTLVVPPSYTSYMKMIGTLECVKLELYRRAVGPYEDTKKDQNGDVY